MKTLLLLLFTCFVAALNAQTDSSSLKKSTTVTHGDSLYLARLNSSGNLMIAGGVGLCGVGAFLIYEGTKVYSTAPAPNSTDPAADTERNHRQGTIYLAAGGVSIVGGIILTAFGARNKVDFKRRKAQLSLQSGILDNGHLGLALAF